MAFVKNIVNKYVQYRKKPCEEQKRNITEIRDEV